MKLFVTFDTQYRLTINLYDTDFVSRWVSVLKEDLKKNNILQTDTYCSLMTEEQAKAILIESIVKINTFLKTDLIAIPTGDDFENLDYYNYLHSKFEKLAGPSWENPTRLVLVAPIDIRLAIRHINRFCHRLESRPYKVEPFMRIEFDSSIRVPLHDQDYNFFEVIDEPGAVVLDYATLGKTLFECFQDGLAPDYIGLKHQHHYCSNFKLKFQSEYSQEKIKEFNDWIEVNQLKNLPKSVFGEIKLGCFDPLAYNEIIKTSKILNITIE
jgi:hypothetical protein